MTKTKNNFWNLESMSPDDDDEDDDGDNDDQAKMLMMKNSPLLKREI